jgi:sec-independent protein translocase protein TatA
MGGISLTHILILLVIVLIFFGPSRLPQLGQSLGKAIRDFKKGLNEINNDSDEVKREELPRATASRDGQNQTESTKEKV